MKEKLAPYIKRINPKLFSINSAFLSVNPKPLLEYLKTFRKGIHLLLDDKMKILIIENNLIENLAIEDIEISRIFIKTQGLPFPEIKDAYFDFIIVLGEKNPGIISPEDVANYIKNQSCPIFISNENESLINILQKRP